MAQGRGSKQSLNTKPVFRYDSRDHPGEPLPPELRAALSGFRLPETDGAGRSIPYRFREQALYDGAELYVMGQAARHNGGVVMSYQSMMRPLLVSDAPEEEVERRYYVFFKLAIIAVLAVMAVIVIVGVLRMP